MLNSTVLSDKLMIHLIPLFYFNLFFLELNPWCFITSSAKSVFLDKQGTEGESPTRSFMLHLRNVWDFRVAWKIKLRKQVPGQLQANFALWGKKQVVGRKTRFPANWEFVQKPSVVKAMFLNLSHVKVGRLISPRIPQPAHPPLFILLYSNIFSTEYLQQKGIARTERKETFPPPRKKIALPRVASHLFVCFWLQC